MISLPDFKEKKLLFVKADWGTPSHLRFHNDNIVFEKSEIGEDGKKGKPKVVNRVSVHKTFAIFIAGDLSFTTQFLRNAREHGVSIFFLKNNLEPYSSMMSAAEGHYALRVKQYSLTTEREYEMAKAIVKNKIQNQAALLKEKADKVQRAAITARFEETVAKIDAAATEEELLGIEGNFSRYYFSQYFGENEWRRRAPRTREDVINLLMDIGYTFLFNVTDALLRLHGFDTYKGIYHTQFFQRRSLACDIEEPFRCIIDKQIKKAYNLGQINEKDFTFTNGAFVLPFDKQAKYATLFLDAMMEHKQEIFEYVHGFYQHMMKPETYPFPEYTFE